MAARASPQSARIFVKFLRGKYPGVSLRLLLFCRRHGFYPERAQEYDFTKYRPEDYFPDNNGESPGRTIDTDEEVCCLDKVVFALYMGALGANTPPVLVEHAAGRLIFYTDAQSLEALVCAHGALVVKPRGNIGGGVGVRIVCHGDPNPELRPGEFATPYVQQHAYAAEIYPGSANTIRILTAWDYDREDVFVAAATHRFGSSRAVGVDNWSSGGLAAGIDLETGRLGPGIRKPNFDRKRTRYQTHPDTGAQIEGVVIPRFCEMCADLLRVARRFPRRYVGWDIVMTPQSWTYLEANHVPALGLFQFHRPLLLDNPRLRAFYRREGVLNQAAVKSRGRVPLGSVARP